MDEPVGQHPKQDERVQSLDSREICHMCGLQTYNVVAGQPQCLFHHETLATPRR